MTPPDGLTAAASQCDDAVFPTALRPPSAALRVNGAALIGTLGASLLLLWGVSLALPLIFQAVGGINRDAYRLLDVRHEGNLPTLFATVQLLFAAAICLLIAGLDKARRRYWVGLVAVFGFLGIDETAQLHELLGYMTIALPDAFLREWTWALIYGPAALLIAGLYVPFLRRLPFATASAFIVGGALFLLGSLGLEVLGTYHAKLLTLPRNHAHFSLQLHAEELCELLGIFIFIWGAWRYLQRRWPRIHLSTR